MFKDPVSKIFSCISIISLWQIMTCMGRGLYGPHRRGTVGSIYKGEYYTLVHTTYESSGPYGFGEDFFMFFQL